MQRQVLSEMKFWMFHEIWFKTGGGEITDWTRLTMFIYEDDMNFASDDEIFVIPCFV